MIYVVTGHRPNKLNGYSPDAQTLLEDFAFTLLWQELDDPDYIITGMAQGWDQAVARACIRADIPFLAAVPCDNQEGMWPRPARDKYLELMKSAVAVKKVTPGSYSPEKMQLRNQWMVDQATAPTDKVVALWDGTPGGTRNCIQYAQFKRVEVLNVWDKWQASPKLIR